MSTTPAKYRASKRLVDDEAQLRKLFIERDLTVREIANDHASVSRTTVHNALVSFGLAGNSERHGDEGLDPPKQPQTTVDAQSTVTWVRDE